MSLTEDEKYYTNDKGEKFARVTSVITTEEDRFDPNSPWSTPSSAVGTGMDIFGRDFFDGEMGNPNTLAERYPNADQKHLRKLYDDLQRIKESIKGRFTVVPKDVTLSGQLTVTDKNGKKYNINVAGTVDLLIHDNDGNFYIYDMKTHHSNEPIDHNPVKLERYTKQVSLYKALFEKQYPGHPVKSLALMPIHVEYPAPKGWRNGTAEYTSNKNTNQLFLNGKEFRAANPVLEKTIKVNPKELEIKYEDLSDEAKAIAVPVEEKDNTINPDNQRSEDTKPTDWSVATQELIDHMESMGLNVLNETAMQKYFEEHPNALVQMAKAYGKEHPYENSKHRGKIPEILDIVKANKYDNLGTDAVTLESEGHKRIYLIDHSADSELAGNLKKGDGFGIRKTYNIENITEEDVREIIRNIAPFYDYSTARVRYVLQALGIEKKHLFKFNLDDELKRLADSNNAVYGKLGRGQSAGENGFRGYYDNSSEQSGRDERSLGQKASSQVTEDGTETFTTPQGEVYGFIDKYNNIYLDRTKISPEHPIHEYTHIWDRVIAKKNPELWQKGVSLMKQTTLWNEILNDSNYGKKWQAVKGISQSQLDNLIASEVHARLVGEGGMELIERLSKRKGQKGIISKLKQWLHDFWKDLKATFSPWSKEELDRLTPEDLVNMTLRDFANGLNPLEVKENTINNKCLHGFLQEWGVAFMQ